MSGPPQGYDETGSVSSAIPGVGVSAYTSSGSYHTYEMEAETMASIFYDFAAYPDYRALVLSGSVTTGVPGSSRARGKVGKFQTRGSTGR